MPGYHESRRAATAGGMGESDPGPREPQPAPAPYRVLVVEDSEDVGTILASALEEEGCVAYVARSGAAALAMVREIQPHLVTLDIGLPGMSGTDVLAALRADPRTRAIPIVAISAHANQLDPALGAQVARVIRKPFYLAEVVQAVMGALDAPAPSAEEA